MYLMHTFFFNLIPKQYLNASKLSTFESKMRYLQQSLI